MKLIKLFAILFISKFCFSQGLFENNYSFDVLLTSYNSVLKKSQIRTISKNDISFIEDYKINYEIGANFFFKRKYNFRTGVGFTFQNFQHSFSSLFKQSTGLANTNTYWNYKIQNDITVNTFGIKILSKFHLLKKTEVVLVLDVNVPIIVKYKTPNGENAYNGIYSSENVYSNIHSVKNYVIPELNFKTNIYNNLSVLYGFKLRFWSDGLFYEQKIVKEKKVLLDYRIDSRQLGFFVGLNYAFELM